MRADADVGDYILIQTGFQQDGVTIDTHNTYWFPYKKVEAGDFVVIYTRKGRENQRALEDGKNVHFFYWDFPDQYGRQKTATRCSCARPNGSAKNPRTFDPHAEQNHSPQQNNPFHKKHWKSFRAFPMSSPKKYLLLIPIIALAIAVGYWWGISAFKEPVAPVPESAHQNRLGEELSPYLRLHAHNPVDWYPWGEEALARARREDKPIFLSVGYSSCYWCHVMERRVFSDPAIAQLMNQFFVNIKVDREERPDIDEIYMTATQLITGRGGWPNSVFLTPDLKPFYAGTYFPPEDAPGRPGFPRVIQALHVAWQENRQALEKQADQISQSIARMHTAHSSSEHGEADLIAQALDHIETRFDPRNGGLGTAPKFPPDHALGLLLTAYRRDAQPKYLAMATQTLSHMARGGIRDHLAGGFHRYATDARWRVPHFEKMLYNQALLVHNFLRAYQITGEMAYRMAAEEILDFVSNDMTDPKGGFYTALDAETDAEEGAYYTWTETDIRQILKTDADFFLACYALAPCPKGRQAFCTKPRQTARWRRVIKLTLRPCTRAYPRSKKNS